MLFIAVLCHLMSLYKSILPFLACLSVLILILAVIFRPDQENGYTSLVNTYMEVQNMVLVLSILNLREVISENLGLNNTCLSNVSPGRCNNKSLIPSKKVRKSWG